MVRFTLKQCAYFVAVVEHGGIAQAGRALNISQPAIAQGLDKLEDIYGLRLLDRHHARGTELTPEGRSFLPLAKDLIERATMVERKAASIASSTSGTVHLGCFHTLAPFYLSQIVRTHGSCRPAVRVIPSEHTQDELNAALVSGALDLALTYEMSLDTSRLDWIEVNQLQPFVILPQGHPLARKAAVSISDLIDEPFVTFDGAGSTDYFRRTLERGGNRLRVAYRSRSMEAVRSAVGNGLGYSLTVMRPRTRETYDGGSIVHVPIKDKVDRLPIVIAFRNDTGASDLVDDLVDTCRKEVSKHNEVTENRRRRPKSRRAKP